MADVTNLFRATVKSVKSRHKITNDLKINGKSDILPHAKHRGDFEVKTKEMVNTISKLRDFLLEHRKEYVNAGGHLSGDTSCMTDAEREQIDTEAQAIIKRCQETIGSIRQNAVSQRVHPQVKEHRDAVLTLIQNYLKVVCKIYSEQKAVRVKRVVDRKRISKLEPERKVSRPTRLKGTDSEDLSTNAKPVSVTSSSSAPSTSTSDDSKDKKQRVPTTPDGPSYMEDEDISPEEAQMFEQENQAMFEEMNSLASEVSQIQGKVIEIARLQEIFTDKILEQEGDINRIAETTVTSTENIKDANEEIREAMKKNAGFRVWILFFLLVLTFSLLFLDWYSG